MAPPRKDKISYRRYLNRPNHPLAGRGGLIGEHRAVLYEKIGPGKHQCHWCKRVVEWMVGKYTKKGALLADHLDGDIFNNDPENLVPSCNTCNATRTKKVGDDEIFIVNNTGSRVRAEKRKCATCKKTFLFSPSKGGHGPNRGKYCSIECLWDRERD